MQISTSYSKMRSALAKLSNEDQGYVFNFIRLAMVDASSVIFGTLDGSHFPLNIDGDFIVSYNGDEFEKQWLSSFNKIKNNYFSEDCIDITKRIREASFKLSFKVCGDSDISAYISDDFEMISKYFLLNDTEGWPLKYLLSQYLRGRFPG